MQGVGLGMILLQVRRSLDDDESSMFIVKHPPQTLSRLHVCVTLVLAQIIGAICVMVARATAPNAIGPGTVFPNIGTWDFSQGISGSPMAAAPFWIALICQIVIVLGYFWFYRKEQLCMSACRFFCSRSLTCVLFSSPPITRTSINFFLCLSRWTSCISSHCQYK